MNITRRAMFQKSAPVKDKGRLAAVAAMPCCVCSEFGMTQTSPTEVHHLICGRFSQAKAGDDATIPLCRYHHRGPGGIHTIRAEWINSYGPDADWLEWTNDRISE